MFTIEDVNSGHARGWTFSSGWFRFHHTASAWAWFRREVTNG
jgi:hypothetical protein